MKGTNVKKRLQRATPGRLGLGLLAFLALTFVALTLLPGPAVSPASAQDDDTTGQDQEEVTAEQCETRFNSSGANATCSQSIRAFSVNSVGQCRIQTACLTTFQQLRSTSITVDLDDVDDLNNCNGSLTVGSC